MYKCPGFQPQLHIKPAVFENIFYPRLRQENPGFEATLGYKGRFWLVFVFPSIYNAIVFYKWSNILVRDISELFKLWNLGCNLTLRSLKHCSCEQREGLQMGRSELVL